MSKSALVACILERKRMGEIDAKIVHALAQCNMNLTVAAQKLHYHRNTLEYHVAQIRKNTGLDPRNFFRPGRVVYYGD